MHDFDLFVIGAGSGGVRAARTAAGLGASVAVAEERYLGGTCVNVGCIPKKYYAMAAHYRHDFEDSAGYGWRVAPPTFDWATLRDNKRHEISRLNSIYGSLLEKAGVQLLQGRARLLDGHTVEVAGQRYSARHILVATGGRPHFPELPGAELALSSDQIFDLDEFPGRIMIVGGGYIAVEFAGIFAGLGAQTLLSYRGSLPLRGFDLDLRKRFLAEARKQQGLQLLLETTPAAIEKQAGSLRVRMADGASQLVDVVLLATGRKPNTEGLGLREAGVELNADGSIVVDGQYRSSVPSILAIGDVVGHMALTPVALAEAMVVARQLFGAGAATMSYHNIPTAVFSQPNLACVGLDEEAALARHSRLRIYESDFRALRHTLSGRDERSYMKVIVDDADDKVLGLHMLGPEAGEIIQGFAVALGCGLTKTQLDMTLGIHPTLAEEFVTMRTPSRLRDREQESHGLQGGE